MLLLSQKVENKENLAQKILNFAKEELDKNGENPKAKSKDIEMIANLSKYHYLKM